MEKHKGMADEILEYDSMVNIIAIADIARDISPKKFLLLSSSTRACVSIN